MQQQFFTLEAMQSILFKDLEKTILFGFHWIELDNRDTFKLLSSSGTAWIK